MFVLNRFFVFLFFSASILAGCADLGTPTQPKSEDVAVTKIGAKDEARPALKRQQLAVEIMRYGDRYHARMSLEADRIKAKATTPELRWFSIGWKLACQTAVVEIAVGPNAVENLLDMMVLASLTREEVETYWVPEVLGPELGQGLLKASRQLEEEIWEGSSRVLTPEQQSDLRALLHEWNEQHPDQHYFWGIRLAGFTDQRAVELQQVQQTGGLLGEVSQIRETADEMRAFGERVMYYMQRAPNLTRLQAEFGTQEVLNMPEVSQVLNDTNRITRSTERYAAVLEKLPADMEAVITHMFDELSKEREAAIAQIAQQQQEAIKALLISEELQTAVTNIGSEGEEITNTAFIRGVLLVLVWGVIFVIGRVIADKFRIRYQNKQQNIE
ncbi:MAG: hypothetical protein OEU74_03640 [Gammaproteobacteria bacterium]|nr:hypothetical protein [Gammaproteobacteria bacterium]